MAENSANRERIVSLLRFAGKKGAGGAWLILDCAQHSHPPNPDRTETRSCPGEHSYRARSASRRTTRLPAQFFSILLEEAVFFEITLVDDGGRFGGKLSPFLQQAFDVFPDQI